jgi:hypothetical protein
MPIPQFVTKIETYGGAYQISNGDDIRTPRTYDDINCDKKSRSVQRLGYRAEKKGNMLRFERGSNVLTKADI